MEIRQHFYSDQFGRGEQPIPVVYDTKACKWNVEYADIWVSADSAIKAVEMFLSALKNREGEPKEKMPTLINIQTQANYMYSAITYHCSKRIEGYGTNPQEALQNLLDAIK